MPGYVPEPELGRYDPPEQEDYSEPRPRYCGVCFGYGYHFDACPETPDDNG